MLAMFKRALSTWFPGRQAGITSAPRRGAALHLFFFFSVFFLEKPKRLHRIAAPWFGAAKEHDDVGEEAGRQRRLWHENTNTNTHTHTHSHPSAYPSISLSIRITTH